jgi:hypothetical protein
MKIQSRLIVFRHGNYESINNGKPSETSRVTKKKTEQLLELQAPLPLVNVVGKKVGSVEKC